MTMNSNNSTTLYLNLIKKTLMNQVYMNCEYQTIAAQHGWKGLITRYLSRRGFRLIRPRPGDAASRLAGKDVSPFAHTMIGQRRLDNVQWCAHQVIANQVPGDFIETGVWRGGTTIFMRAILKAYEVKDRRVWVADSFEGLPAPDVEKYPLDAESLFHLREDLSVSLEQVKANFEAYGLLDEQVCFLEGWFRNTLPTASIQKLSILRLDGDMYESTMDSLSNLYPKLSVGGYCIIDDYEIAMCRQAVHAYRDKYQITEEIVPIDSAGVYWQRAK